MAIKLVPWEEKRILKLNARWKKDGMVAAKQTREKIEPEYGIYIMQSMRGNERIYFKIGKKPWTLEAKHIFRIGGIGVRRAFGSKKGNSARSRLYECNKDQNVQGIKLAKNWKYIFGASILEDGYKGDHLAFLAASAESMLQHQFTQIFEYLGYSHFNCLEVKRVKIEANRFVKLFNENVAPLLQ